MIYQYFRNSSEHCQQKQLSLSDQELVIPSWRSSRPSLHRQVLTNGNGTSQVNVKKTTLYPSPHTIWDTPQYQTMLQWQPKEEAPPSPGFIQDEMVQEPTSDKVREHPSRCSIKIKSFKKEEANTNSDDIGRFLSFDKSHQHNSLNNLRNVQMSNIATIEKKENENLKSCLKSECHPTTQGDLAKQNVNFKVACK